MKITSITLGGFKGIKEKAILPLAPITLFFGANSTGKSTILHGLLYLYEVLINRNPDPEFSSLVGENLYFGGFKNLVNGKDESGVITLGLTLDMSEEGSAVENYLSEAEEWMVENYIEDYPEAIADKWGFELEVAWSVYDERPYIRKYSVFANDEHFCTIERKSGGKTSFISYLKLHDSWVMPESLEAINDYLGQSWVAAAIDTEEHAIPESYKRIKLVSTHWDWDHIFPDHPLSAATFCEAAFSQACIGPLQTLTKYLKNTLHIGPIRLIPGRNFITQSTYSAARWYDGSGAWDALAYENDNFMGTSLIDLWFRDSEGFNTSYEFDVIDTDNEDVSSNKVVITDTDSEVSFNLAQVGVGISQVVPFMVGTFRWGAGILSCEQPELHIHPRWQLALADMLLQRINSEWGQQQFLIETHSEHLLLRLLKRRRETAEGDIDTYLKRCKKQDIQIIFCEQGAEGTTLLPINTTDEGEFDAPWPNGFFKERRDELI